MEVLSIVILIRSVTTDQLAKPDWMKKVCRHFDEDHKLSSCCAFPENVIKLFQILKSSEACFAKMRRR